MKPEQISQLLNHIASGIENSKNPKKELVIRDLKNVISRMAMNFIDTNKIDPDEEISTTEGDVVTPKELEQQGFKYEHALVLHDGSVAYFLVEDNGQKKWFTLRYD